nr:hypothetical protein [Bradyrhizobium oropedii]
MNRLLGYCRHHDDPQRILRTRRGPHSVFVSQHADGGDEAVATSADVDDEAISFLSVAQHTAERRHMDREIIWLDIDVWPNANHQLLLADDLTAVFEQNDKKFEGATSDRDRLLAFQQKELSGKQTKPSK